MVRWPWPSPCAASRMPGVIMHTDAYCNNAVIESWHSTLEFELRRAEHFTTKTAARARVAAWIEDYNTRRRHSSCRAEHRFLHDADDGLDAAGDHGLHQHYGHPADELSRPGVVGGYDALASGMIIV